MRYFYLVIISFFISCTSTKQSINESKSISQYETIEEYANSEFDLLHDKLEYLQRKTLAQFESRIAKNEDEELLISFRESYMQESKLLLKEILSDHEFNIMNDTEVKIWSKSIKNLPISANANTKEIYFNPEFLDELIKYLSSQRIQMFKKDFDSYMYIFNQFLLIDPELDPFKEANPINENNSSLFEDVISSLITTNFITFYELHELYHLCCQNNDLSEHNNELEADGFALNRIISINDLVYQRFDVKSLESKLKHELDPFLKELYNGNSSTQMAYVLTNVHDFLIAKLLNDPLHNYNEINSLLYRQESIIRNLIRKSNNGKSPLYGYENPIFVQKMQEEKIEIKSNREYLLNAKNIITQFEKITSEGRNDLEAVLELTKEENWAPSIVTNYLLSNNKKKEAFQVVKEFSKDQDPSLLFKYGKNANLDIMYFNHQYSKLMYYKMCEILFDDYHEAISTLESCIGKNKLMPDSYYLDNLKRLQLKVTHDNNR